MIGGWIDENLDHRMILSRDDPAISALEELGEPMFLLNANPTAENIARSIANYAIEQGFVVTEVRLWETPRCVATYRPSDANRARALQEQCGLEPIAVDLGEGVVMRLVPIPAGAFVMGSSTGHPDERPTSRVGIDGPFWIGQCEVTNAQFARFDAAHDSQVEPMHGYQFGVHGYPANQPDQPVVRVSWNEATANLGDAKLSEWGLTGSLSKRR